MLTRSRKRKIEEEPVVVDKKKKKTEWISPSNLRNYLIRDPLVDWLKLVYPKIEDDDPVKQFIMQQGKDFEDKVIEYIRENIAPVTTVSSFITPESCRETIRLMRLGEPFIHSAPVRNEKAKTQGIIDLLVRSDYLSHLTDTPPKDYPYQQRAKNLNGCYHYVVIDVKFSTLPLRADGIHLLNSGSYPFYKSQLYVYMSIVNDIQGFDGTKSFILGRRWRFTQKDEIFSSTSCFDRLGQIDYASVDSEYIRLTNEAIDWVKLLRKEGYMWTTNPPTRKELYPNMCVDSGKWNKEKKEIATRLGDITQLWYCGIRNRQIAEENGIYSWRDKNCTAHNIGINGQRARIVNKIIEINQQNVDLVRPKKINSSWNNWRDTNIEDVFIDFETFCDIFASFEELPDQPKTDQIFMIGVYYRGIDGWTYRNFITETATFKGERKMMTDFILFIRQFNNPRLWYWHADKDIWTRAENRQMDLACNDGDVLQADTIVDDWQLTNWVDLCQLFRDEPIVIKNCFKFGLKEVASTLYEHGLIETKLDAECGSGIEASIKTWQVYQTEDNPLTHPVITDISKYNHFDVKVLWEILTYLRNHH